MLKKKTKPAKRLIIKHAILGLEPSLQPDALLEWTLDPGLIHSQLRGLIVDDMLVSLPHPSTYTEALILSVVIFGWGL